MIATEDETAVRTTMGTNCKGLRDHRTTARAHLTCASGVHLQQLTTSLFRFVRQHLNEGTPAGIADALSKPVVLDHIAYLQVFDTDCAELLDVRVSQFMQEILSLADDLLVCFSNKSPGPLPASGALLPPGESALSSSEDSFRFTEEPGVLYLCPFTVYKVVSKPNVNPGCFVGCGKDFRGHVITGEVHEPSRGRPLDSNGFNPPLNRSGEEELESPDILDCEVLPAETPTGLCKGERVISTKQSESWEPCLYPWGLAAPEERLESQVNPTNNVLEDLRTDRSELREVGLELRELHCLPVVGRRGSSLCVPDNSLFEAKVVKRLAERKPTDAVGLCHTTDLRLVFEGTSHVCFLGTSQYGLLHLGHVRTSDFRGTHVCPQRSHLIFLISTLTLVTIPYAELNVNNHSRESSSVSFS